LSVHTIIQNLETALWCWALLSDYSTIQIWPGGRYFLL